MDGSDDAKRAAKKVLDLLQPNTVTKIVAFHSVEHPIALALTVPLTIEGPNHPSMSPERIKEEYMLGKSPQAAEKAGFKKALWTIIDANITTFIAAIFLSQIGSGPVQGFAYTLAVGILSSMFTVLFVSRLIFDFSIETLKVRKLSITWRRIK